MSDDQLWHEMSALLEGRPGWRIEASSSPGAPPSWCFEHGGEVALSVSTDSGRIDVYLMDTDRDVSLASVEALAQWLDQNEEAMADNPLTVTEVVDDIVHGDIVHWGTESGS